MTESEAIERAVEVAEGEEGYYEKASNAELDDKTANAGSKNWNKFARDVDACKGWMNGNKNGYEWCCMFVCATFLYSFGYPTARLMLYQPEHSYAAACKYAFNYFKQNGAAYTTPEPGDQIFFDYGHGIAHTGLVEKVTDSYVYTIEGNAGNEVQAKKYARSNKNIVGYGRPNWALVADVPEPAPEPTPPPVPAPISHSTLHRGSKGTEVREMQNKLILHGFSLPRYGADGDFGAETEAAVRNFQRANGLEVDGICGPKTWAALDKTPADKHTTYTVVRGDTLSAIAKKYGTTVPKIAELNGIDKPNLIRVGQRLKIPIGG